MNFHDLAALRRYLTVKHHIPGRIRVTFDPALAFRPEIRKLAQERPDIPEGVTNVRVNILATSVIIEYDPGRIKPRLLDDLINADDKKAADILRELHDALGM
ncbi:HMA2 domain-containing protein [Desulfonatronum parangueonense]